LCLDHFVSGVDVPEAETAERVSLTTWNVAGRPGRQRRC